jgi:hypothetical protein
LIKKITVISLGISLGAMVISFVVTVNKKREHFQVKPMGFDCGPAFPRQMRRCLPHFSGSTDFHMEK